MDHRVELLLCNTMTRVSRKVRFGLTTSIEQVRRNRGTVLQFMKRLTPSKSLIKWLIPHVITPSDYKIRENPRQICSSSSSVAVRLYPESPPLYGGLPRISPHTPYPKARKGATTLPTSRNSSPPQSPRSPPRTPPTASSTHHSAPPPTPQGHKPCTHRRSNRPWRWRRRSPRP